MNIRQTLDVVRRQWIAVIVVLAIGTFAILRYEFKSHDSYAGNAHVLLVTQPGARDSTVSISDLPVVATSTIVLERVQRSLGLPISLMELKSHVSAKVVQRSSIMEISYHDPDRLLAIAVPNSVADNLSLYYGEISASNYTRNVKNLSAALALQSQKIASINKQLELAVASDPFVISEHSADDVTQRIDKLETDRATAQADLAAGVALADTTSPSATLSRVSRHEKLQGNPRYKALTESSARDFAQLETDRSGYTERFPGLAGETAKVENESKAVSTEMQRTLTDSNSFSQSESNTIALHAQQMATISGDKDRVVKLDALIAEEKSRLNDLSGTGLRAGTLRAARDVAQADYNQLSNRRAAALANRAEAFSLGSIQVLDRAIVADTMIGTQRSMIAFIVSLLLIALALGTAFLADALDPRLKRVEQIEALYGRPVIADIGSR